MPNGDEFCGYAETLSHYIDKMALKRGELILLFEQFWGETTNFASPCASWEDLSERIKNKTEELREDSDGEETLASYIAEKWEPDGNSFKKKTEYIIADGEVCGLRSKEAGSRQKRLPILGECADLSLPMPFAPGDIVLLDCAPFAPPQRAVVLECSDDQHNFRSPLILYYHCEKRVWKTGTIKNKHLFSDSVSSPLSPLYKIDYALKPIPGESKNVSKRLKAVSEYIRGSEEKTRRLFSSVFNFKCENDRRKDGITKERLLDYLNEAC